MRNTAFAALAASLMLTACTPAAQPLSPADETAIRALVDRFNAAVNANNADAMTADFTSDATIHPDQMPAAVGTEAIHQLWTGMLGQMRVTRFAHVVTKISGEGNVAYLTGTYHVEATTADSAHAPIPPGDGKFIQVLWRQADKSWKVVADSWNTNAMPAAAAPAPPARRR